MQEEEAGIGKGVIGLKRDPVRRGVLKVFSKAEARRRARSFGFTASSLVEYTTWLIGESLQVVRKLEGSPRG